jgi:hypothetical protein
MRTHRRTAATVAAFALAAGLLGLTACNRPGAPEAGQGGVAEAAAAPALDLAAGLEEQALAALGFEPAELAPSEPSASPDPGPSAGPGKGQRGKNRRPLARSLLRGRVLHAEAVVQTDEGVKTLVSQRGKITAIDGDSVTVRSTDGFSLTWTFGDKLRVIERRRTVQPTDLVVGTEIGVAGAEDGDKAVARLIVRRPPK